MERTLIQRILLASIVCCVFWWVAELMKNPVDGFSVGLADDNNIYEWHCMMEGPPDSDYEGTHSLTRSLTHVHQWQAHSRQRE